MLARIRWQYKAPLPFPYLGKWTRKEKEDAYVRHLALGGACTYGWIGGQFLVPVIMAAELREGMACLVRAAANGTEYEVLIRGKKQVEVRDVRG